MSKQQSGGLVERNITLRTAVLMMYCLVAAGAFGIEGMISEAGPGMTIVILCVLPFIWAAPVSYTHLDVYKRQEMRMTSI